MELLIVQFFPVTRLILEFL